MELIEQAVLNDGNALGGASVTVYYAGTTDKAAVYDSAGVAKANPFTADADGKISFRAVNGDYDLSITASGYTTKTFRITLSDTHEYYPEPSAADQGATSNGSLKYWVDLIGSDEATVVFGHKGIDGSTTTYTFSTSITVPSNIRIVVEKGARLSTGSGKTITCNGVVSAGNYQIMAGYKNLVFALNCGMAAVPVEWFGTDATALSKALAATVSAYIDVSIGDTVVTLDADVTVNKSYAAIRGLAGNNRSRIDTGNYTLKIGTRANCRQLSFVDIMFTTSGSATKVMEFTKDGSGDAAAETFFVRCRMSGGTYTIYSEGGFIDLTLDGTVVNNDGNGVYAIYINQTAPPATPYGNGLNIVNGTRIAGNCYVHMSRSLNVGGAIIECSYGTAALLVKGVVGGFISGGSYFETDGITPIEIEDDVYGLTVLGNMIDKGTGAVPHIKCSGKSVIIGSNDFQSITAAQTVIELEASSKHCSVLENYGGDYDGIPKVTDAGTRNFVWSATEERIWIPAIDWRPVSTTQTRDLVLDGGFENFTGTADDGVTDDFDDWIEAGSYEYDTIEAATGPFTGAYCLKVVRNTGGDPYVYQDISVTEMPVRCMIRLSFWTKGDGTHAGMYRIYDVTNSANILAKTTTGVTAAKWTFVRYNFRRPSGCNTIRIEFHMSNAALGYAYFDNVSMFEELEIITGLGMPHYPMPLGIATILERLVKLPSNITRRNGADTSQIIFEVYFKAEIEHDVTADWTVRVCEVNENDVPRNPGSVLTLDAQPGSHVALQGGNILLLLKCTLPTMTMESLTSQFLQLRAGRSGSGSYYADLLFYGLLIRILHVTR